MFTLYEFVVIFSQTFFLLLFGHFLADFPLQNNYVAKMKNRELNPTSTWPLVMFGHCMIHAGIVFIITGSLALGIFQLFTHFAIDTLRCSCVFGEGDRAVWLDQFLHVTVLVVTALIFTAF